METTGQRLKEERERLGLTQPSLCEATGVSRKTLYNYETGKSLPNTAFLETVNKLGFDRHYVETGERYGAVLSKELKAIRTGTNRVVESLLRVLQLPDTLIAKAQEAAIAGEDDKAIDRLFTEAQVHGMGGDFVFVPRYDVRASAGNGSVIHDESIVDHLAFRREWVTKSVGCDPKHLALIEVHGDSMSPTLMDMDLVLLDTRPCMPRTEGVYVIRLGDALLVKRLHFKLSGVVEVISDNPTYKPETVSREQLDQLTLIGRVVWHGRKF